jgi:hypothetical protein|tara:strand:- start:2682 stop:2990 length:309 start_codon:yes stop_codon:yes gene_type:complete
MEITIGNIKYPLRASMRAWRKFEKATGVKVSEVDSSDVTMIPELIFYFVQEGCESQGMRFTMDVDEWLGKIEVTDLPDLVEVITEVMGGTTGEKKKAKKANR